MRKLLIGLIIVSPALFAGCAATPDKGLEIPPDSDPRVGEEVQLVCYVRDLDGWQNVENDGKAVILRMKNGDTFKLKLKGGCYPHFADLNLAIRTRSKSGCYSPGDKVKTDGDVTGSSGSECTVASIHKWDEKAVSKTEITEQ
jgi:hypothetical protein